MNKNLDELLKHALTPTELPDSRLNQTIINACRNRQNGGNMKFSFKPSTGCAPACAGGIKRKRRIPAAALTAALTLGLGSLTVLAAWQYLLPEAIAEQSGDEKLAAAFTGEDSITINETQSGGGYQVTLSGIVSGENISEWPHISNGEARPGRTYAVVAIEHADGSPMQEESSAEMPERFFVSPLIRGCHPAFYNAASMHGNYSEFVSEGVLYRLVECDNVEIFADRDLYLCVSEGSDFFPADAYCYDPETGAISRNEDYQGLNALFKLPVDASKADPEKAEEYLLSLGITIPDISPEKRSVTLAEDFSVEASPENEKGAEAAEYALQFIGNPYAWNGESLTEGCDCSGFTKEIFGHFGISLPHSTAGQKECGEEISGLENALPGDLFFYEKPGHVGIYIGDGMIVHAEPTCGICVSEADYGEIKMIRRLF